MPEFVCIAVLAGPPGSGKTTLAKCLRDQLVDPFIVFYISYDELMDSETERQLIVSSEDSNYSQWRQYRRQIVTLVGVLIDNLLENQCSIEIDSKNEENNGNEVRESETAMSSELNKTLILKFQKLIETQAQVVHDHSKVVLLIDDNMYLRSMRYSYFQLIRKSPKLRFIQCCLRCSTEIAVSRNQRRTEPVPLSVIQKMVDRFEYPDCPRARWETHSLVIDSESGCDGALLVHDIVQLISAAEMQFPSPDDDSAIRSQSQLETKKSHLHQADLSLRKAVQERISSIKETDRQSIGHSLAKKLLQKKQDALTELRAQIADGVVATVQDAIDLCFEVFNS